MRDSTRPSHWTKMWLRKITYPQVQTYAIPHITEWFYAGSTILIALLVVFNIAAVGNDVVTTLKKDPNNADSKWWGWVPASLAIPTTPGPCQPLILPQHSASIRTNSTLPIFSYKLMNGLGKSQNGTAMWFDSLPYRSEPLQNCVVQDMTVLINFQDRGHQVTSQILCNVNSRNPNTPQVLKFSTTFSRMANADLGSDDIVDYISSFSTPRSTDINEAQDAPLATDTLTLKAADIPALKVLGVLDAIGSDLLKQLWAQKWSWKIGGLDNMWPDQGVVKWSSQADCTSARNDALQRCRNTGAGVEGIDTWYSNTRGAQDWNATYFRGMNTTIYNYITVLRDAIHLDMGNVDYQNNVFLNQDAFRSRILPDPFLNLTAPSVIGKPRPPPFSGTYTTEQFWSTCSWGWGCYEGTWTEAILNNVPSASSITNGLPLQSSDNQTPVVINADYMCPVYQMKRIGPLLVSVFIGTFSMYLALYGIFLLVAPRLDNWYRMKYGVVPHSSEDEENGGGQYRHLNNPYQAPPQSSTAYNTIFEVSEPRNYSTEPIPRYDPTPESTFGRTAREEESSWPRVNPPATSAPVPSSSRPSLSAREARPMSLIRSSNASTLTVSSGQPLVARDASGLPGYSDPYDTSETQKSRPSLGLENVDFAPQSAKSAMPLMVNPEGVHTHKSLTASMVSGPR